MYRPSRPIPTITLKASSARFIFPTASSHWECWWPNRGLGRRVSPLHTLQAPTPRPSRSIAAIVRLTMQTAGIIPPPYVALF